ncbi:DsbE family thiol:disulfide interchange protein [Alkalilimnicola ehrlichii MLHE-1]|uniref:Periplasmic protein thiol--disulfide oxidoreductase DsbE n=1 Tax=Alkalilimnicola ehrlichii (strain ATCC BAA-1101 / DSM 17681 / MLHE-1) TaxID=187272 RepID=Q0A803_ALKEH|nr:DsbE family thiol:disulfide interchange protein [Alkalilimnicola ehrlichii]ABI57034.1 periplasmic protein thiol--disulfide oxidoreductase DsbE [Alkalilimnicola ehrlichii MLHE-1]
MLRAGLPLLVLLSLAALLWVGLGLNPRAIPSPLIDREAPAFHLPDLQDPTRTVSRDDLLGRVTVVNVWASWCTSCRQEHPVLQQLADRGVHLIGLNYKDDPAAARELLAEAGNPYARTARDGDGRAGIDWGVYATPETFVVDREGVVRHKHTGPLTAEIAREQILPLIRELEATP